MYKLRKQLQDVYLDWLNNFVSTDRFAEYYGLTLEQAVKLLDVARDVHEKSVKNLS